MRASRVKVEYTPPAGPPMNHCDRNWPGATANACPVWAKKCVDFIPNHQWGHCVQEAIPGGPGGHGNVANATNMPAMVPWTSEDGKTNGFVAINGTAFPAQWLTSSTTSIEATWPIVVANWIEPRCTVASISADRTKLTLASPCGRNVAAREGAKPLQLPIYFEAAPGYPLAQGVFYHDRDNRVIYYNPLQGQTKDAASTISVQEVLVRYANVTGHTWEHVAFSHTTWFQANTDDGFVDTQSIVYKCQPTSANCSKGGQGEPLGAVQVASSTELTFQFCSFVHLGSAYGLSAWKSSTRITAHSNTFDDLSGGFLKLGSIDPSNGAGSADPSQWDSHFSATHNTASNQAVEYSGAAGFFGGYLFSADISHNTVSDAGYSGFSVGWGWGGTDCPGFGNNTVSYNKIYNVMSKLQDGGGIYVNGATNPDHGWNTMSNNWVNNDEHEFAVYYLDNGASHWHVTHNVASNSTTAWAYFMTGGTGDPTNAAHNNTFDYFWYENDEGPRNNCPQYGCRVDNATVFHISPPATMPPAAVAIMNAAGAKP